MEIKNSKLTLFNEISIMIEQSRRAIYAKANSTMILLFWRIGQSINKEILQDKRADYGKQIVSRLAAQLSEKYGRSFELRNLQNNFLILKLCRQ